MFRGFTGAFSLAISLLVEAGASSHGLGDTGKSGGLDDAMAEGLVVKGESSVVRSKPDFEVVMYLCAQPELQLRRILRLSCKKGLRHVETGSRVSRDSF